jgi:hypothetical protein
MPINPFDQFDEAKTSENPFNKFDEKPSVWEAVKQGAKQAFSQEHRDELAKKVSPMAAERMAAPVRFATGAARIPANLMRMAGIEAPAKAVSAVEEGAKRFTEQAGAKGILPGAANIGGEIALGGGLLKAAQFAKPLVQMLPGGKTLVAVLEGSPLAQTMAGGAGLGMAGSTGSPQDILQEGALGALTGGAFHGLVSGTGKVLSPVLERYKELKKQGFTDEQLKNTSIGQFFGGKTQAVENFLSDLPFSGAASVKEKGAKSLDEILASKKEAVNTQTKTATSGIDLAKQEAKILEERALQQQQEAAEKKLLSHFDNQKLIQAEKEADVHLPFINRSLEKIGVTVPPGMSGNEAILYGQKAISKAYKDALANIGSLRLTSPIQNELLDLTKQYNKSKLGPYAEMFQDDIASLIGSAGKGKWLNSENWQGNLSSLSERAYQSSTKGADLFEKNYGKALGELKEKWMDLIEGQAGSDAFKAANKAFSEFQAPQKAASYVKSLTEGGEFTPQSLLNAIRSGTSVKRVAGGEDELQKMAQEAYKKIVTERQALEKAKKEGLEKFNAAKQSEKQKLSDKHRTQLEINAQKQKDYLQTLADKQKETYEKTVAKVKETPTQEYAQRRLAYNLSGLGGASYGLSHLIGLSPWAALGVGAAGIGGSRMLYSKPVQDAIKKAAIIERPEAVIKLGEGLKQAAPLSGLTAVQQYQNMRNAPKEEEEEPQGGLPVPQ